MSQIILDFGSGNTCHNDWTYAKRMIDELKAVDTGKHEIIIKWRDTEEGANRYKFGQSRRAKLLAGH